MSRHPHVGVEGIQRTEPWLVFDPIGDDLRRSIFEEALNYGRYTCSFDGVGIRPGSLVVEISRARSKDITVRRSSVGFHILTREEWACSDEEWREALQADALYVPVVRPTVTVTYVQYGPRSGDVCRWWNGFFVVVK